MKISLSNLINYFSVSGDSKRKKCPNKNGSLTAAEVFRCKLLTSELFLAPQSTLPSKVTVNMDRHILFLTCISITNQ